MGAWGSGNFENDAVCDWLATLPGWFSIHCALADVLYPPSGASASVNACCVALGAAEIVAVGLGRPAKAPERALEWAALHRNRCDEHLRTVAVASTRQIKTASKLQELFDDDEPAEDWHAELQDLLDRLTNGVSNPGAFTSTQSCAVTWFVASLRGFCQLQQRLRHEMRAQFSVSSFFELPKVGTLDVDGANWSFKRHGAGVLFSEEETHQLIDIHDEFERPELFDSWCLSTYFGALGNRAVQMVETAARASGQALDANLESVLNIIEQSAQIGRVERWHYRLV